MAAAIRTRFPAACFDIGAGYDFQNVGFGAYNVLDITKAHEQLGYIPEFDLPFTQSTGQSRPAVVAVPA